MKDAKDPQDLSYIVKKEENKDSKLSNNLLNGKKEKKIHIMENIFLYCNINVIMSIFILCIFNKASYY